MLQINKNSKEVIQVKVLKLALGFSVSFKYGSAHSLMSPCCKTFSNLMTRNTSVEGYVMENIAERLRVEISVRGLCSFTNFLHHSLFMSK